MSNGRTSISDDGETAARLAAHSARLDAIDERLREADRESGVLASVDAGLTALANGQRETLKAIEREGKERRVADLRMQKRIERATAMPLAIVAFFVGSASGLDPKTTIAGTLVLVAAAIFAPERLNREAARLKEQLERARRQDEPPSSEATDETTVVRPRGNGRGNGKEP